jgi:hypothetical protein
MKPAYNEEAVEAANEKTIGEQMRFQLSFAIMMLNCKRDDMANDAFQKLLKLIETVE